MATITKGIEHLGLAVKDLKITANFFIQALGFTKLGDKLDYPAMFLTDGVVKITLWQLRTQEMSVEFNRFTNVGLHHVAFKVDEEELDQIFTRLSEFEGVTIEFAPEFMGTGLSRHMMVTEPGGIRIEFTARKKN